MEISQRDLKLNWKNFEHLFGSWKEKIKPFFLQGEFDNIYKQLKEDARRGQQIAPNSNLTFRAFQECDINKLKLVIVVDTPYNDFINGQPMADGLCMSCSITKKIDPILSNFLDACELELYEGLCLPCIRNSDLTYLAKNEGVLLLNVALTTTKQNAKAHLNLWKPFMQYLFEEVLDVQGIPILLIGENSHKLEKYINPFNTIFKLPSIEANKDWDSGNTFREINKLLKRKNNETINWFDESEEIPF